MAQVRALVRKLVVEELLSSEVLEIRVIDPALARTFVGQAVNMLEQKKPDHKPCRNSRPTTVAIQRCDLAVDKVPVDLTRRFIAGDQMKALGAYAAHEPPSNPRARDARRQGKSGLALDAQRKSVREKRPTRQAVSDVDVSVQSSFSNFQGSILRPFPMRAMLSMDTFRSDRSIALR